LIIYSTNIPESEYYLKIAYGKDWLSKIENGQCKGKFIRSPSYEKGEDVLDFNRIKTLEGYSIPCYSLSLDVIANESNNSFNAEMVNEDEFNR
jgi:hypothetical protein